MNRVSCGSKTGQHLEKGSVLTNNSGHIRPLAVSPLNHSERVPTPWGFTFSRSKKMMRSGR